MKLTKVLYTTIICLAGILPFGCEEFVTVDPPTTEVVRETVFSNDASAISAMSGIYSQMIESTGIMNCALEQFTGASADELLSYTNNDDEEQFVNNALTSRNIYVQSVFWQPAYKYINNANAVIEGLAEATSINGNTRTQLLGEALFVRALCHFYLVNLFGDIPYISTTDFEVNAIAGRDLEELVYQRMEADLVEARDLLLDDFTFAGQERIRPNKGAATALLARIYLYSQQWQKAEEMATELVGNSSTYALSLDVAEVFNPASTETIWQLRPVMPGDNTHQANAFILNAPPDGFANRYALTESLYNSFEPGDARQSNWVGSVNSTDATYYYSSKYKAVRDGSTSPKEYSVVFRLAEQYLIRAETRTQQNKLAGAISDLDIIRTRAGLPRIADTNPSISQQDLLSKIEAERRVELFLEWGHRWLDLKRTGRADAVLSVVKPGWQPASAWYPIPWADLTNNPNLLPQNEGY